MQVRRDARPDEHSLGNSRRGGVSDGVGSSSVSFTLARKEKIENCLFRNGGGCG